MGDIGKMIVVTGLVLVLVGAVVWLAAKTPLGRLPGDIVIHRRHFTFAFPLVTSILISVILTLLLWVFSRLRR